MEYVFYTDPLIERPQQVLELYTKTLMSKSESDRFVFTIILDLIFLHLSPIRLTLVVPDVDVTVSIVLTLTGLGRTSYLSLPDDVMAVSDAKCRAPIHLARLYSSST
jgi:hypothetical protein